MFLDHVDNIEYTTSKEEYEKLHSEDNVYLYRENVFIRDLGNCKIAVNGFAGNIPHFEIISEDEQFKSCIKLYEPEYYFRDNKEFSKLSNDQIDDLIRYLTTKEDSKIDNHGWMCIEWRNLNTEKKYEHYNERDFEPDYTKLKEVNNV